MHQTSNGHVSRALTIAGSDSGGGAGIQADLKTMQQFGVYGMSVLTALTAQNTLGVQGIQELSPAFVHRQLQSVFDDLGADAVKTGMLSSGPIIREVASFLEEANVKRLVVDPVMVAKGGSPLLSPDAVETLKAALLPLAYVVTPNVPEAEVLCGYPITGWKLWQQAAIDIASLGPSVVIIKGGHASSDWLHAAPLPIPPDSNLSVDIVYSNGSFSYYATPRVDSKNTHGTGCTFSAAIAAMLANEALLHDAIAAAKAFVYHAIAGSRAWDVGSGHGPTNHSAPVTTPRLPAEPGFFVLANDNWTDLLHK